MESSLKTLYSNKGYFDKYGGSVFFTILSIIVFTGLIGYFSVNSKLKEYKKQWVQKRCSPEFIPFAGIIHPESGKSSFETTRDNFQKCTNTILEEIAEYEYEPIYFLIQAVRSVMGSASGAVNSFRHMLDELRNYIASIFARLYEQIEAVLVPIHLIFIKSKDILHRSHGVMTAMLYTVMSGYLSLRSFISVFLDIIIIALSVLASVIVGLFALVFTIPEAIALLAVFVAVVGLIAPVALWAENLMAITSPSIPKKPSCFTQNTPVKIYKKSPFTKKQTSTTVKMKHIQPRDILYSDIYRFQSLNTNLHSNYKERVCATMKVDASDTNLVRIEGITISETHPVLWTTEFDNLRVKNNKEYCIIPDEFVVGREYSAKDVANALYPSKDHRVPNQKTLYCLSTTSKLLSFYPSKRGLKRLKRYKHTQTPNKVITTDWDELDSTDIETLSTFTRKLITHRLMTTHQVPTLAHYECVESIPENVLIYHTPMINRYNLSWIHKYLEGGFHPESKVCVNTSGKTKRISKLCLKDRIVIPLVSNEHSPNSPNSPNYRIKWIRDQIKAIVKIEVDELEGIYSYHWTNTLNHPPTAHCWIGGPNCMRYIQHDEVFKETNIPLYSNRYDTTLLWDQKVLVPDKLIPTYLYHVITYSGLVMINGVVMYDYNGCLDNILGETKLNIPRDC